MKIGILTFYNALNYGAVLQCYALKEVLCSRGHEVEIINYKVKKIVESEKLIPSALIQQKKGLFAKCKLLAISIVTLPRNIRAKCVFKAFLEDLFIFSRDIMSYKDIPDYYDYIIFGSDQIWNPRICNGFDSILCGDFPKGKTKFVSYAASLGEVSEITYEQWKVINHFLSNFDAISVRETTLHKAISEKTNYKSVTCLDPTLLAGKEIFEKITVRPNMSKYIFLFLLQKDPYAIKYAQKMAKLMDCKIVIVSARPQLHHVSGCIYKEGISPYEFLGYIKYAECIITNSFHGTAFSILFNKNFYALQAIRSSRVDSILGLLNLEDRIVKSTDEPCILKDIDYYIINNNLKQIRRESEDFLKSSNL